MNEKNNKKGIVALILLVSLSIMAIYALRPIVAQQLSTVVYVDPPQVVYNTLVVGQRFGVNVTVANVTDLVSINFNLSFNPSMLQVVSEAFMPAANLPVPNLQVDGVGGSFWANVTYNPTVSTSSPTALVNIVFKIAAYGISPLSLTSCELANASGLIGNVQVNGGQVSVLEHDVAITGLSASTNETYQGDIVNVTAIAANLGMAPENFTVSIYANTTLLATYPIVNLQPSQTYTCIANWNTSDLAAVSPYVLSANASAVPYETNLANNVLTNGTVLVKILGDVNGDGKVDINDLIAWNAAYGSTPGSPNWNPQADILGDGVVDKADGIVIIENYGNTVP
jgi:uncharacterized protein (DUF2141 family)